MSFNYRFDSLYGFPVPREPSISRFAGIDIIESPLADLATRTVFKVVKSHPRARRRRYTVQRTQEPCILSFNHPLTGRPVVVVHPSLMPKLKEAAC